MFVLCFKTNPFFGGLSCFWWFLEVFGGFVVSGFGVSSCFILFLG